MIILLTVTNVIFHVIYIIDIIYIIDTLSKSRK